MLFKTLYWQGRCCELPLCEESWRARILEEATFFVCLVGWFSSHIYVAPTYCRGHEFEQQCSTLQNTSEDGLSFKSALLSIDRDVVLVMIMVMEVRLSESRGEEKRNKLQKYAAKFCLWIRKGFYFPEKIHHCTTWVTLWTCVSSQVETGICLAVEANAIIFCIWNRWICVHCWKSRLIISCCRQLNTFNWCFDYLCCFVVWVNNLHNSWFNPPPPSPLCHLRDLASTKCVYKSLHTDRQT